MIHAADMTLIGSSLKPAVPSLIDPFKSVSSRPRILVVDDVPGIREILTEVFDRAGYCVMTAEDGEMAWDTLRACSFDLLLTDHEMPRLTGTELLRRVRASSMSLPVILMSGRIPYEEGDLDELTRNGLIMAKPLSFSELLKNVRNLLAQNAPVACSSDDDGQTLNGFDRSSPSEVEGTWQDAPETSSSARRLVGVE
jgi:DNA-binding response OmpR family regulator